MSSCTANVVMKHAVEYARVTGGISRYHWRNKEPTPAICKIINYVRVLSQLYCRSLTLTLNHSDVDREDCGQDLVGFYLYWASYEIHIAKCHRHNQSQSHGSNLNSEMSDMTNMFLLHLNHSSSNWVSAFSRVSMVWCCVSIIPWIPS